MPNATQPLRLRIASIRREAHDIRAFRLVATDGAALPAFTPGAHVRVHGQRGGAAAIGACSLVNGPSDLGHYEIGVLREGRGGVSDWLHTLEPRAALDVESPRNDFPLAPHATGHVLIAGGIGLTPLLAMASHLAARGAPFNLWVLARNRDRLAFSGRLNDLPASSVHVHFSETDGRLDLARALQGSEPDRHAYVCGPRGLIDAASAAARSVGMPEGRVHVERFDAGVDAASDRAFDVELRASGMHLRIEPGESILGRLLDAGMFPSHDCRRGECGTCLTRVLDGVPEHRDSVQTDAEKAGNAFMTICCSRAKTDGLVLDL
jgi:vanillate O-demethylase ferredoxin subunit